MTSHSPKAFPNVLPLRVYLAVGVALMLLTAVTVTVSMIPLGGWNLVVALAVAASKALLVAFFFMHLYYDNKIYFAIFSIGLLLLTVFIVLLMFDTMERGAIDEIKARPIKARAAMYDSLRSGAHEEESPSRSDTAKVTLDSTRAQSDTSQRSTTSGH